MHDLASAKVGMLTCVGVDPRNPAMKRLEQMGICENARFELASTGNPMIVRIGHTFIGVSKQLAKWIDVEPADCPQPVKLIRLSRGVEAGSSCGGTPFQTREMLLLDNRHDRLPSGLVPGSTILENSTGSSGPAAELQLASPETVDC